MILSISVIIISTLLCAVALFFLLGTPIKDIKKQQILVIVGLLIFLSIMISNFKSQDIFTFSLLNSISKNKINSIFANQMPPYSLKHNLDPSALGTYLFDRNYAFDPGNKDYNQYIIYLSNKNDGASFFMHQLAQKFRAKGYPAFYVKMESPAGTSKQFFRKTGLNSFEAFKSSIDYYLQQKTKPYIVVDNAQLLPRPVWDILYGFEQSKSPHVILNTQNTEALLERISEVDRGSKMIGNSDTFLKRFQVQKFVGPDQGALQKLSPSNWFLKKLPIHFGTISQFKSGANEQQIFLKSSNAGNNVANYFGVSNYYNQIKRLLERGPLGFGKLRQTDIPFEIIQQLQRLGLINIKNGLVSME